MRNTRFSLAPVLVSFLMLLGNTARGNDILEEVLITGSPDNRVDLVFTGDGYTSAQANLFRSHVENLMGVIFSETPWSGYMGFFNIYQVITQSNESGADHPSQDIYRDTYFDSTFDYYGIQRLTWANVSKIITVVTELVPQVDQIVLIINDPAYGGSGGTVAMVSVHQDSGRILLHELGHSLGGLADEYTDPYPGYPEGDHEPNVDFNYTFDEIKWNLWIDPGTPLPTLMSNAIDNYNPVGAYEGARYLSTGIYRPAPNCIMRTLNHRYCDVCREAMVQGFYGFVEPMDWVAPSSANLVVDRGSGDLLPVLFEAEPVSTMTGDSLEVGWRLDGQPLHDGPELAFDPNGLGLQNGEYSLEVVVVDSTTWVRKDPEERLVSRHLWNITVVGEAPDGGTLPVDAAVGDASLAPDALVGGFDAGAGDGRWGATTFVGGCACSHLESNPGNPGSTALLIFILLSLGLWSKRRMNIKWDLR